MRWLTWLGVRSYAVYLLHQAMSGLFHEPYRAGDPMMTNGTEVGLTLGALATTLVLAEVSFRTLESRFIAFGRRWRYAVEPGQGLDVPAP
jgi:peptidoglycan/LPS O-acetylase OafA/YrhL